MSTQADRLRQGVRLVLEARRGAAAAAAELEAAAAEAASLAGTTEAMRALLRPQDAPDVLARALDPR